MMEGATLKALIAGLLAWISLYTGYPAPEHQPGLAMVSHAGLERMACAGPCPVLGFYRDDGIVYLDDDLPLATNVCAQSILVHELVHYVQHLQDRFAEFDPAMRWQLRELEAHRIQSLFLVRNGIGGATSRNIALRAVTGSACSVRARGSGHDR